MGQEFDEGCVNPLIGDKKTVIEVLEYDAIEMRATSFVTAVAVTGENDRDECGQRSIITCETMSLQPRLQVKGRCDYGTCSA